MKTTKKTKDNSWKSLFGALVLDQPADEFVEELKKDRYFNRKRSGRSFEARNIQRMMQLAGVFPGEQINR